MNQMTEAMLELANMDELAKMDSLVHKRHPLTKLVITIVYIATVVSFSKEQFSALIPMILYPVLMFQLSGIRVRTCFYKLRFILPLVCAVGIWNPILDRVPVLHVRNLVITSGMITFVTLLLKGVFSLMASFLLIATTGIEQICYALSVLKVPDILVTQLLITYRYISLLLREAGTMVNAYALRAPDQKGIHISAWGSFLGQLLLRSMDRVDLIFFIGMLMLIIILRFVNISVLIGNLFV